jgi:hypothetical protein
MYASVTDVAATTLTEFDGALAVPRPQKQQWKPPSLDAKAPEGSLIYVKTSCKKIKK